MDTAEPFKSPLIPAKMLVSQNIIYPPQRMFLDRTMFTTYFLKKKVRQKTPWLVVSCHFQGLMDF